MAFIHNETNILLFCSWVAQWLIRWDTTTLVIENRSLGQALIDYLLYMLPGHVPAAEAGTEFVQFSPREQLAETLAAMRANAARAMQGG